MLRGPRVGFTACRLSRCPLDRRVLPESHKATICAHRDSQCNNPTIASPEESSKTPGRTRFHWLPTIAGSRIWEVKSLVKVVPFCAYEVPAKLTVSLPDKRQRNGSTSDLPIKRSDPVGSHRCRGHLAELNLGGAEADDPMPSRGSAMAS